MPTYEWLRARQRYVDFKKFEKTVKEFGWPQ